MILVMALASLMKLIHGQQEGQPFDGDLLNGRQRGGKDDKAAASDTPPLLSRLP